MPKYTVTIHATQTIEVDNVADAKKAIKKAIKSLTDDWRLEDAVAVDIMNQSFSEEFYDNDTIPL